MVFSSKKAVSSGGRTSTTSTAPATASASGNSNNANNNNNNNRNRGPPQSESRVQLLSSPRESNHELETSHYDNVAALRADHDGDFSEAESEEWADQGQGGDDDSDAEQQQVAKAKKQEEEEERMRSELFSFSKKRASASVASEPPPYDSSHERKVRPVSTRRKLDDDDEENGGGDGDGDEDGHVQSARHRTSTRRQSHQYAAGGEYEMNGYGGADDNQDGELTQEEQRRMQALLDDEPYDDGGSNAHAGGMSAMMQFHASAAGLEQETAVDDGYIYDEVAPVPSAPTASSNGTRTVAAVKRRSSAMSIKEKYRPQQDQQQQKQHQPIAMRKHAFRMRDELDSDEFLRRSYRWSRSTLDGRLVDYVLVYTLPESKTFNELQDELVGTLKDMKHCAAEGKKMPYKLPKYIKQALKRYWLEHRLQKHYNVFLEHEISEHGSFVFVKVHAPLETLHREATRNQLKLPLAKQSVQEEFVVDSLFVKLGKCFRAIGNCLPKSRKLTHVNDAPIETRYMAPFRYQSKEKYLDADNPRLFTDSERSLMVYQMLLHTRYGRKVDQVGVQRLLQNKSYVAAFPLHDSPLVQEDGVKTGDERGQRAILYEQWARFSCFYKRQPLQRIRNYFGEKIALYFTFLGFYLSWLWVPSLLGILSFVYGVGTFQDRTDVNDLCSSNFTMCALCQTCETFPLKSSCSSYKWSYVFDNEATLVFAVIMSVWATIFLDFWKRENSTVAHKWNIMGVEESEPIRGRFRGNQTRPNPVTGKMEEWYPASTRSAKYFVSFFTIAVMLVMVIIVTVSVIVYRLAIRIALVEKAQDKNMADTIASVTAAVINLVAIMTLDQIYGSLALLLTDWENHKTESKYEAHLTFKIFLFQFINSNASLFYIAFFKGRFSGIPGNYHTFLGYRQDECPAHGCLLELTIQLAIIMVGKQAINNFMEILLPRLKIWLSSRSRNSDGSGGGGSAGRRDSGVAWGRTNLLPWEADYMKLAPYPDLGAFSDYLELVMQFGFITLFVSAFPLAPFFALVNNILEIRVDAIKLIVSLRRPPALRASTIGIWETVLQAVCIFSVITNGLVIAITSDLIQRLTYKERTGSMDDYINALFPLSSVTGSGLPNQENCHFRGFYDDQGKETTLYYEVIMAKLAFFIAFEHVVFFIKVVAMAIIPDVPKEIDLSIKREEYQARRALEGVGDNEDDDDAADAAAACADSDFEIDDEEEQAAAAAAPAAHEDEGVTTNV
eukprot:m.202843 g.202843  ORF g.202843 m.202843 type:complete len:1233 (+) comp17727_c0_seq5:156-3854(+)